MNLIAGDGVRLTPDGSGSITIDVFTEEDWRIVGLEDYDPPCMFPGELRNLDGYILQDMAVASYL